MATPIFVSSNTDDESTSLRSLIQRDNLEGEIVVNNDISYNGANEIDWEIEHTMDGCAASTFVIEEQIDNTNEMTDVVCGEQPMLSTQLPGMKDQTQQAFDNSECPVVSWDPQTLSRTLYRC